MSGRTPASAALRPPRTEEIRAATELDALIRLARELRAEALERARAGAAASNLSEFISTGNDAICARLIELERADALPGVDVCWIVMGSQGRREQTLHTDQDNAIVFDCDADPGEVRSALSVVARRVNERMDACGIPFCSGGIMAGNPKWCLSLDEWKRRFATWLDRGDPPALLNAAIFFDFRALGGQTALASDLRDWLAAAARGHTRFLLQLTIAALENRPPLGVFGGFTLATHGGIRRTLDLKVNAATPFADAARIYGLAAGVKATGTVERLLGAAAIPIVAPTHAAACAEAFRNVQDLRIRVQAFGLDAHRNGGNVVDPSQLPGADRRMLKSAMREALRLQQCLARDFAALAPSFGA